MKTNSRLTITLVLCLGVLYCLLPPTSFLQVSSTGKIIFTSLDRRDITYPGLEVFIEGGDSKRRYVLGVEPLTVDLPPGTYQITATCNYFYPFRRSPLQLSPGETIRINLLPALHVLSIASGVNEKGAFCEYTHAPPVRYESFLLTPSSPLNPHLLIRFDQKKGRGRTVEYAAKLDNTLMASYGTISIYADKIRFNKQDSMLEAEGNVYFEDGKTRTWHPNLRIRFTNGQAVILPN